MTVRLVRNKFTPRVAYAEYSGCIHAKTTQDTCPFCGSELKSILRKARNA